ncbi:MAG: hypothetical protein ACRD3G_14005 [Vicinamibacterales bacterium]
MRRISSLLLSCAVVFGTAFSDAAIVEDGAGELVRRAQQALGGTGRFSSVQTMAVRGRRFRGAAADPFTWTIEWPHRYEFGTDRISHLLDRQAFSQVPKQPDRFRTTAEATMRAEFIRAAISFLLKPPDVAGGSVQVSRTSVAWQGRTVPAIDVRYENRIVTTLFFDPVSGVPSGRIDRRLVSEGGHTDFVPLRTTFLDYRIVRGIRFPHRLQELDLGGAYSRIDSIDIRSSTR